MWEPAATSILTAALAASVRAVVLIDGRSGAGKSTLMGVLARRWPGEVTALALDSIYPGWDGLDAAAEIVRARILEPRRQGRQARWSRWDWERNAPAEEHSVDPTRPLIIEGAGALTPATAVLADVTVWLDAPEALRKERALARDGDAYRPHWDRWARQEERHIARDDPRSLARFRLDAP